MMTRETLKSLCDSDAFVSRHIGPSDEEIALMLKELGLASLEELVEKAVPAQIRNEEPPDPDASEQQEDDLYDDLYDDPDSPADAAGENAGDGEDP